MSGMDYHIVVIFFALTGVLLLVTGGILFVPAIRRRVKNKHAGDEPQQKKKISILCLAGFIIAALYPLLLAFDYFGLWHLQVALNKTWLDYDRTWLDLTEFFVPIVGIILSIAGLITAGKKGRTGKRFGIAGIVLPNAYIAISVLIVIGTIFTALVENGRTVRIQQNREIYNMRNVEGPANTEYDVSRYRIPEGYDLKSLNISVSEDELKAYAGSKLQTIDLAGDKSTRGKFQGKDFLIVRSDRLEEWLTYNHISNFQYNNGYATLHYDYTWEFAGRGIYMLDVYKDPSDKFIIITNCGDHKIIAEFFEGIGEAVPTETTVEETEDTMDPELRIIVDQEESLRKSINSNMSLLEIISVFEKTCGQTNGKDLIIFKHGVGNFSTSGYPSDPNSSNINFYCFGLARQFQTKDGKYYQIRVEVLSGLNTQNRDFKLTQVNNNEVNGDFFDYIRNSDAYKYASTAKIRKINIYLTEI